jgi:coiled-coil domain-containing protein 77
MATKFPDERELEKLPLSHDLLLYYRARVKEFEAEQATSDAAVANLQPIYEEVHRLRLDVRKRDDEIAALQKALLDAQSYVFDERQQLLRVVADNDALRMQEAEDRRRIQHLLALTGASTGQEITYLRQTAPERIAHRPQSAAGAHQQPGAPTRVLRTVYLPSEKMDTLLLTVEALRAQMDEQQKLSTAQIAALHEQRRVLEESERVVR